MKPSGRLEVVSCAIAVLALFQLLQCLPSSDAAVQCSDVLSDLANCVGYITGSGTGAPPAACCSGVSKLASSATTPADRKAACSCLRSAGQRIKFNPGAVTALPRGCGVTLPFAISPNMDCSKIS